jgi:hypothetical protein
MEKPNMADGSMAQILLYEISPVIVTATNVQSLL